MGTSRKSAIPSGLTCLLLACGPLATLESDTAVDSQGDALFGENLAGTNLAGANLAGNNLAGVNLAGANLGGTNLGGANLAGTNLAGTNLAGNNLAGNNLAGTNLAGANLAGANLAGANLAGANLAGSNLGGTNLAGANLAGTNLAGTNLVGATLTTKGVGLNIHKLASANGMLPSGEDLWSDRAHACVVAGIGSTAFSKLVNENAAITTTTITKTFAAYSPPAGSITVNDYYLGSYTGPYYTGSSTFTLPTGAFNLRVIPTGSAYLRTSVKLGNTTLENTYGTGMELQSPPSGNGTLTLTYGTGTVSVTISYDLAGSSKMYAAIKKTTWGVAATSGGPKVLDAWEALVWGSKTYCSFVMFAPPSATFAGVAGFMKAIWRWNAPITMSMDIGQIGGGQTVKTYKGMNNVADLWRRGLVSEKAHIGGELALITATTNNIGVSADFSGWIAGTSGRGLRLAGVDGIPAFNEGSYLAIDTGSGTVAILLRMKSETYFIAKNPSRCTEWDCDAYIPFENLGHLGRAYDAAPTRVVPKRCAGWAYLASTGRILRSAIPAGKCDDYLKYGAADGFVEDRGTSARPWTEVFPDYYQEPIVGAYLSADGPDYDYSFNNGKHVLAETYIFLNEAAY